MHALPLRLADRIDELVDPCDSASAALTRGFEAYAKEVLSEEAVLGLERERRFPEGELREFARRGLIDTFAPDSADWSCAIRLAVRFSAHEPDVLLCLGGTALGTLPILVAGTANQKERLRTVLRRGEMAGFGLSEWNRGLDILGNDARAEPVSADGTSCSMQDAPFFRLHGTKAPVNNATRGAIVTALVRTAEGREAGSQSLFMIDRATVSLVPGKAFDSLGYRMMDLSSIVLDGVTVPRAALLGKVGEGFHHARRALEISRGGVSSMAAGLSVRACALAAFHAESRVLYGAKVSEIPSVRALLGQSYARAVEGVALARMTARMLAHSTVSARHLTCAAKMMIPELLERNVHDCGTVLGARSLLEELPFARLRRTAPVYAVFDGSTLLQKDELWRCLITWRDAGTLHANAFVERMHALLSPSPAFDPHRDDGELTESLSPPALLDATGRVLADAGLTLLGRAATLLAKEAPAFRRAEGHVKQAASECAGALYAVAALGAFTAVADEARRAALLPPLSLRVAAALLDVRRTFDVLELSDPELTSACTEAHRKWAGAAEATGALLALL